MAITELDLTPNVREVHWVINVSETDASAGIELMPATTDYRYGIRRMIINCGDENQTIQIMDGDNIMIGPFLLKENAPINIDFSSPVYCTVNNALVLQTSAECAIHLLIQGMTGLPVPGISTNPSPADQATGVSIDTDLSWDSEFESMTYNVYLGDTHNSVDNATPASDEYMTNQGETTYDPGTLLGNTTYYWRIDQTHDTEIKKGIVWRFTTTG